jgi:hypothetical protein
VNSLAPNPSPIAMGEGSTRRLPSPAAAGEGRGVREFLLNRLRMEYTPRVPTAARNSFAEPLDNGGVYV